MADPVEAQLIFEEAMTRARRTVVPGLLGNVTRDADRERDADFTLGVADLVAGEADPGSLTPDAPVMCMVGGGSYILMQAAEGDEALGLASDRALDEWRADRFPGVAPTFERFKDSSDMLVLPFAITAPIGAPDTWEGVVIGGPEGPAIELPPDGSITITKQGAPVATIEMPTDGSITITPGPGQSVNVGGAGAAALVLAQQLTTAIDALLAAGVGAGTGAPGTTGTLAFTAATSTWNGLKAAIATQIAKGL